MYRRETDGVEVTVEPAFLDAQSEPAEGRYVWAYRVRIANLGPRTVQLISRHWRITDAFGRTQEVRGPGVVGEQPVLPPGAAFEYASGAPLPTPSGFMAGTYRMLTEDGAEFDAEIPAFSLDSPYMAAGRPN